MEELVAELDSSMRAMWLDRPEDVSRMVGRNYDTHKEFSVWAYTWGYLSNLSDELYSLHQVAARGEGDLETLKMFIALQCRNYAGSFEHAAHMSDCQRLLLAAADGFEGVASFGELARLSRALQRYLLQLSFWVDMELPWAEVSEYVDKRWHER